MSDFALNRWQLEKNNQTLTIFGLVLLGLCTALVFTLMISVNVNKVSHSNEILEDFVTRVCRNVFTFDVMSFDGQLEQVSKYVNENVIVQLKESYIENKELLEEHEINQVYSIKDVTIQEGKNPYLVKIEGERLISSYINPENTNSVSTNYLFEIENTRISRRNPYGLKVIQIHEYPRIEDK